MARGWRVQIPAQPAKETLRLGHSSHSDSSLSRPLNSSRIQPCRNHCPCCCSSRRPSGPVIALGLAILLYASQRVPGILSGVFSVVWARGNTRLFDVKSLRRVISFPSSLSLPLYPSPLVRGPPAKHLRG